MDPVSAAAASAATTAGTTAATGAYMAAGAGAAQASMLAAQTAGFGLAGTASTLGALGAPGMAGAVSGLSSIGAGLGSLGTVMSYASLPLTIYSGVQSAKAEGRAAELQAQGMQAQSFQEGLKAEEEAILRRERLIKALASQSAAGGAAGVSGGSAEALQLTSLQDFEREQRSANLMTRTQQDIYRRKIAGTLEAGGMAKRGELLSTATKLTEIG
jgi:hypothetical protein